MGNKGWDSLVTLTKFCVDRLHAAYSITTMATLIVRASATEIRSEIQWYFNNQYVTGDIYREEYKVYGQLVLLKIDNFSYR